MLISIVSFGAIAVNASSPEIRDVKVTTKADDPQLWSDFSVECRLDTDIKGAKRVIALWDMDKKRFFMDSSGDPLIGYDNNASDPKGIYFYNFQSKDFPRATTASPVKFETFIYVYDYEMKNVLSKKSAGKFVWDGKSIRKLK